MEGATPLLFPLVDAHGAVLELQNLQEDVSTLFPTRSTEAPPEFQFEQFLQDEGFLYIPDFITEQEEQRIIEEVDSRPWPQYIGRRCQVYGYQYNLTRPCYLDESQSLMPIEPGTMLDSLRSRLLEEGFTTQEFDQISANEYCPGQGIKSHVDRPLFWGDTIVGISLLSPVVMDFSHLKYKELSFSMLLEPRSLLKMSGAARYQWRHGIKRRKVDIVEGMELLRQRRVSLTFRTMRSDTCMKTEPTTHCSNCGQVGHNRRTCKSDTL